MKKYNSPIIEIEIINVEDVILNSPFAETQANEVCFDWNLQEDVNANLF